MNIKQLKLFIIGLFSILIFTNSSYGMDFKLKIDPLAQQLIKDGIAVGFTIGLYKDNKIQVISYGEKIKGKGIKPDANTVYEIGSISKVFTGILLTSMIEKGTVKLDESIQKYLSDPKYKSITFKHLATHTSGLPRMPENFKPKDPFNPYADYTIKKMMDFLKGYSLNKSTGEYVYSNLGMGLLGYLLAKKMNMSYENLLIKFITKPLNMNDTCITLNTNLQKRLASPYDITLNRGKNWDIPALAGAGAIRSTCNDMLKFIKANLKKNNTLLSKAIQSSHKKYHTMKNGLAIGLGWHIARDNITLWHNGMTGGYAGWLAVIPSKDIGVIVLANTATMRITEFGEQVTRILFGIEVMSFPSRKIVDVDQKILESYTGYYTMTPEFGLTITVEDDKLMVQATGQSKCQVFAESDIKFFYKIVDAQITFILDEKGKVIKLILHQNGQDMKAIRK